MGRKLPFTSLFSKPNTTTNNTNDTTPSSSSSSSSSSTSSISSSWAWPSCSNNPRTDSLRFNPNHLYKTINSVFFDSDVETTDTFFSAPLSMSIQEEEEEEEEEDGEESESESIIRSLVKKTSSGSRLIVEPAGNTSSLVVHHDHHLAAAAAVAAPVPFKQSVAMAMESRDPYGDFRRSMEEMVAAHGRMSRDWDWLEELLVWYLRVNGKKNHGFIVGAFVDLLVGLAAAGGGNATATATTTTTSCADDSSENYGDHEKDVSVTTPSNSNCSTMSCVSFEIEEVVDQY